MQKKAAVKISLFISVSLIFGLFIYLNGIILRYKSVQAGSMEVQNTQTTAIATDVSLLLDDAKMLISSPIYLKDYRLYLPLVEFIKSMNGSIDNNNGTWTISYKNCVSTIEEKDNKYNKNGELIILKEKLQEFNGKKYISFIDIENIMGFWSEWDFENKKISIYSNKGTVTKGKCDGQIPALIRMEDIGPGGVYRDSVNLTKLKVISNYLYSKGIPFHVAWIPRYVNPGENYDYDFLKINDLYGAEFVYTFDYLVNRGAVIGLHGYTHQTGKSVSGIGYEFYDIDTNKVIDDEYYMEKHVDKAIETAQKLKLQYYFFESPHYWANKTFKRVMEERFKYLYQSDMLKYNMGQKNIDRRRNGSIYVPTPLGYVYGGENENAVIDNLDKVTSDTLASFFFHPFLEFKYINLNHDGTYTYEKSSKLHKTLDAFDKKGYSFIRIDEIK